MALAEVSYKAFSDGSKPPERSEFDSAVPRTWWKLENQEQADSISTTLARMERQQAPRMTQYIIGARLYGNTALLGLSGVNFARVASSQPWLKDRISYNVVQSALDTVTAKIAKNKPTPQFLTNGGDYKAQRKAKGNNRFLEGVFYENDAYALGTLGFRDGGVFGDGFIHPFDCEGRVKLERVLAAELRVDEVESFSGCPRQLHRVKPVDRGVALEAMTRGLEKAEAERVRAIILDTHPMQFEGGSQDSTADMIMLRESWHLPSGEGASDGRRVMSTDKGIILSEPYEKTYFPFARFAWSRRLFGFFSQGAAEQLQNIQLEINKLLWVIQRSFHLAGSYKVFVENSSKVVKEHLSNEIGALVKYTGTKPEYIVPQIVPPEIFQHLLTLKGAAYEIVGISQLSTSSQKPAGLNSGRALREFQDIESDRFATISQNYERFFVDLGKLTISVAQDIMKRTGKAYKVKAPGKRSLQEINLREISLPEDSFTLKCFPVSSLPNEPAGRLQTIQELMQAGLISPRRGKRLLDFPDLEAEESLSNAEEDYLSMIFDRVIDEDDAPQPVIEPYDDIELAHEMCLEYLARGRAQNLEPEKLQRFQVCLTQIMQLKAAAAPPVAPGGGVTPQAAPEPPPTSDMIPNAPGLQAA